MTRTIKSATDSRKSYFLTLDENGFAIDCSCPDHHYRSYRQCKHMTSYNAAFVQTIAFIGLLARFDVRSEALIQAKRAAWWNFEMQLAA